QSGTTSSTTSGPAAQPFNLEFTGLQAGSYVLEVNKTGWGRATAPVSVNNDQISYKVFSLNPEHVFGRGVALVSIPYTNSTDVATMFGQSPNGFQSAYWLTASSSYALYPAPEASSFALGKGLFVKFANPTAFTAGGTEAPPTDFAITLKPGWNMIGSVRRIPIEWLRVRVDTGAGVLTMQQAMNQGIILNGLFAYIDGYFRSDFMQPFAGYFVKNKSGKNVTLLVPVDNTVGVLTPADRRKYAVLPQPSLAAVAAELSAAGLAPTPAPLGLSQPLFGPAAQPPLRPNPQPTNALLDLWFRHPRRG
ncbi:MAG TPA: hypothetical protein VFU47_12215, partial [Armatimonadota bacterium]|nr:hypothetical protein [Armatimonadota bacterium]